MSINKIKVLGITGARRAGKDTFAQLLTDVALPKCVVKYAFANALKSDLSELFQERFNADIYTLEGDKKELLRPILISYGCVWRDIDPLHWVKTVTENIDKWKAMTQNSVFHCVTDVRFKNEAQYLKEKYGEEFALISITRTDGPEPTEEEKKNMPELESLINHRIVWDTEPSLAAAKETVEKFYNNYIK